MPRQKRYPKTSPKQWAKQLFVQPSTIFYQQPSLYLCGSELELQNFHAVVDYTEDYLLIDLGRGRLRITGDALVIRSLEKGRLVLGGQILSVVFSEE
ncbi:MAG: YabP/YqfC family sporulation protein [Faecalibacterium sp.]